MAEDLRARLHDAQVDWVLGELDEPRLRATLAADLSAVLGALRGTTLAEVVDAERLTALAVALLGHVSGEPAARDLGARVAHVSHHVVSTSPVLLRDVVGRDQAAAAAAAGLQLRGDGRRLTETVLSSPTAVTVGVRIVGRIVSDVLSQNRAIAERLPGVGGLVTLGTSLGGGALSRAGRLGRAVAGESGLDKVVGDALGAGAQATIRRTSGIVHEALSDELLLTILMELYDAHADRTLAELGTDATDEQVADLAEAVHRLVDGAVGSPVTPELAAAGVADLLARHGDDDVVAVLADLGLDEDRILSLTAPVVVAAAARWRRAPGGRAHLHARLAPFWDSPEVAALLAHEGGAPETDERP